MPHLRIRAVESNIVQQLSTAFVDQLQPLMDCPREDFTIELVATQFFAEGEKTQAYPFVEVLWFDRGQETQDQVAKIITDLIKSQYACDDLAVIFTALTPATYYDNGEHY
ncbi:DUF1904 domain-containing protein [Thaumasiovibrio subtropicus]|uniref:DUF1904 domain-containing protein n=1 Tax=Thaumasiovibrio subtropicus TaxID=1891207 RepID=UPI000B34B61F|nr:DUF1904 domain-containing protein [Thaumasiovibrio subtropicus]